MPSSQEPSNARTFRDWFLIGAAAGVAYEIVRNPGSCACCAGCLALILLLVAAAAIFVILDNLFVIAVVVLVVAFLYYGWPRIRSRYLS